MTPAAAPLGAIAQYLARHAEPEAASVAALEGSWGHVLVVPAYGERDSFFPLIGSVPLGPRGEVLIAAVVNARADSPRSVHEANAFVRDRIARELPDFQTLSESPPIRAHRLPAGTLLVVDRAVSGHFIPEGQGVGLARKIGNDAVLALSAAGRIASPWLHNTDADVLLPRDYFEQLEGVDPEGVGSAVYFYDHRFEEDPGSCGSGPALRDLAALLRSGAGVGGLALRLPEHGELPRHSRGRVRGGARVSPQERRRGLLRPRQARQGRDDRAARRHAAAARGPAFRPRPLRNGPGAARPRREEAGARGIPAGASARFRPPGGVAADPEGRRADRRRHGGRVRTHTAGQSVLPRGPSRKRAARAGRVLGGARSGGGHAGAGCPPAPPPHLVRRVSHA